MEEAARSTVCFSVGRSSSEPKLRCLIARLDGQDAAGIGPAEFPGRFGSAHLLGVCPVWDMSRQLLDCGSRGRITEPPSTLDEAALTASCVDSEGLPFRLWQPPRGGRAPGCNNIPGAWNFSDLHTVDPDASAFCTVFGWKFDDIGCDHDSSTRIRRSPRCDVRPGNPPAPIWGPGTASFADAFSWLATTPEAQPPHWHVTFTVADHGEARQGRRAARCDRVVHHGQRLDAGCADSRSAGRESSRSASTRRSQSDR